ncbi:hypothetical protein [Sulfurisoma sediminicola]|nr:hypothetical protein [Sulfurisoma sediminicola]
MRALLIGVFGIPLLNACTDKPHLTMEEKTRFVAELIAERSECNGHWVKLSVPAKDERDLSQSYEAAKAAHCLKPDV